MRPPLTFFYSELILFPHLSRPRYLPSSDSEGGSEGEEGEVDERATMLAALTAHQTAYLSSALPTPLPVASGSGTSTKKEKKREKEVVQAKSIWDMGMDDFDDEDAGTDDDSEEEGQAMVDTIIEEDGTKKKGPIVVAFDEPRLYGGGGGVNKDMRSFMVRPPVFLSHCH